MPVLQNLDNIIQRARDMIKLRDPLAQHYALEWGLMAGHQNYSKFILLGRSRTGSNFLRGLLCSRGGVTVLGEIFGNPEAIEWGTSEFPISRRAHRTYKDNLEDFLDSYIFRTLPRDTEACGFKMFYYHAQEGSRRKIWKRLREMNDLRIIHVKRRNILRTYLSREKAVRSNQWVGLTNERRDDPPIYLNYEDCLQAFIQTRKWEQDHDTFFRDHPVHEIFYEDLSADKTNKMAEVQEFLGLAVKPVTPQTFKQSNTPLSSAIENYSELKERFLDTEWECFFDE